MLIEIRKITMEDTNEYPNLYETINAEFPNLVITDKLKIMGLVLSTCSGCHDDNHGCCCMRDE